MEGRVKRVPSVPVSRKLPDQTEVESNMRVLEYDLAPPAPYIQPPRVPKVGDLIVQKCAPFWGPWFTKPLEVVGVSGKMISVALGQSPNHFRVLSGGYGIAAGQWVFADESFVKQVPELIQQVESLRILISLRKNPAIPRTVERLSEIPPCRNCKEWPCKEDDGCPDYESATKSVKRYDGLTVEECYEIAVGIKAEPQKMESAA